MWNVVVFLFYTLLALCLLSACLFIVRGILRALIDTFL
jgi:hypothetical protein